MTACPRCSSGDLDDLGVQSFEREDDEHEVKVMRFKCSSCGCEFLVTRRTEWETEVRKRGKRS